MKKLLKIEVVKNCEKCGKKFRVIRNVRNDEQIVSKKEKRFCSHSCANGHRHSDEWNKKISKSLKTNSSWYIDGRSKLRKYCKVCGILISRQAKTYCKKCLYKSNEFKETISKATRGKCGGLREGSTTNHKQGRYNCIWFNSSWELAYYLYCKDHNIGIIRNKEGFKYFYNGKWHKYYPDFIHNDGSYVEIKHYINECVKAKIKYFDKPLKIITKGDIEKYIEYAKMKYGKDFIKIYK